jgi:hypothetical protein
MRNSIRAPIAAAPTAAIKHGNAKEMAGGIEAERLNRLTLKAASLAGKALTSTGTNSI